MNHITIVIPTRNRLDKLENTLATIPRVPWITTAVCCDDDLRTYEAMSREHPEVVPWLFSPHRGSVYCRNEVIRQTADGVLYAVDDIEFQPGSIEAALFRFNERFPDDDGVVGFSQIEAGQNWHPTGIALVGSRFIDRYPERRLFFPDYWHFAAQEVHWLAEPLGLFIQPAEALILHNHPMFAKRLGSRDLEQCRMDHTHHEARVKAAQDTRLKEKRKAAGLVWGAAK